MRRLQKFLITDNNYITALIHVAACRTY